MEGGKHTTRKKRKGKGRGTILSEPADISGSDILRTVRMYIPVVLFL